MCQHRQDNQTTNWFRLEPHWKTDGGSHQFLCDRSCLGFGLGIILVTVIVRIIIFPLGIYQSWKATYQSEKMNYLKPIFAPIQERIKNAETQEEKLLANSELMDAQKANGVSPFGGIGCFAFVNQIAFLPLPFHFAAQYTPGISKDVFFLALVSVQKVLL